MCLYVVFLPPGGQISLSFKYKYRFIESYVSQKPQDVVLECVASSTTQIYLVYCYREGKKIKFLLSFNKIKIKKRYERCPQYYLSEQHQHHNGFR